MKVYNARLWLKRDCFEINLILSCAEKQNDSSREVLLKRFHLNGDSIRFHPQTKIRMI